METNNQTNEMLKRRGKKESWGRALRAGWLTGLMLVVALCHHPSIRPVCCVGFWAICCFYCSSLIRRAVFLDHYMDVMLFNLSQNILRKKKKTTPTTSKTDSIDRYDGYNFYLNFVWPDNGRTYRRLIDPMTVYNRIENIINMRFLLLLLSLYDSTTLSSF